MSSHWKTCLAALFLSVLLLPGCGRSGPRMPPGKPITIVILSEGKPVTNVQVFLSGTGGSAELNENGEGLLENVPFGEYKVMVSPVLPESAIIPPADPAAAPSQPVTPTADIPRQFRDETTTPFTISVQADSPDRIELDLNKAKK